ncbi:MAG: flagellar hook-associated protein FlgL [Nitrosomonadales bacterium]|nr:flagellar hook-associated protein FlgL [Nitrosomonadales bacterium]
MRISTSTLFSENVSNLNNLQVRIGQTQQQISTGRRILSPADDPAAAARVTELNQSDAANTQYATNRTAAMNTLSLSEGILQSVTLLLQDAKTVALNAGNSSLNQSDRRSLATELQGRLQELLGLANSTDGVGNFLFSGAQGSTKPFVETATGVQYQGDDIKRNIQVSASRQIAGTDVGSDMFMRVRNGNGTFLAAPVATNTGSGVISPGMVTNPTLYTGQDYQVAFTVTATVPPVTTFSVTDVTTVAPPGVAVPGMTNVPYVSGQAITFNGIQFDVTGAPANGDTFNVTPSSNQSIFATLSNLINTLNSPVAAGNVVTTAAYNQGLSDAMGNLDQGLNNILGVRATMGSRMREIDALQVTGDELSLQFKQTLSQIQDTDYNKAISDLTQQNMVLQAAQQSFAQVSKLSLFNYI